MLYSLASGDPQSPRGTGPNPNPSQGLLGSPKPGYYWEWGGYSNNYPYLQPGAFDPNSYNPSSLMIPSDGPPIYGGSPYGDRYNKVAGVWHERRIPSPYPNTELGEIEARSVQRQAALDEWLRRYGNPGTPRYAGPGNTGVGLSLAQSPDYPIYAAPTYNDEASMLAARQHAEAAQRQGVAGFTRTLAQQKIVGEGGRSGGRQARNKLRFRKSG